MSEYYCILNKNRTIPGHEELGALEPLREIKLRHDYIQIFPDIETALLQIAALTGPDKEFEQIVAQVEVDSDDIKHDEQTYASKITFQYGIDEDELPQVYVKEMFITTGELRKYNINPSESDIVHFSFAPETNIHYPGFAVYTSITAAAEERVKYGQTGDAILNVLCYDTTPSSQWSYDSNAKYVRGAIKIERILDEQTIFDECDKNDVSWCRRVVCIMPSAEENNTFSIIDGKKLKKYEMSETIRKPLQDKRAGETLKYVAAYTCNEESDEIKAIAVLGDVAYDEIDNKTEDTEHTLNNTPDNSEEKTTKISHSDKHQYLFIIDGQMYQSEKVNTLRDALIKIAPKIKPDYMTDVIYDAILNCIKNLDDNAETNIYIFEKLFDCKIYRISETIERVIYTAQN